MLIEVELVVTIRCQKRDDGVGFASDFSNYN